MFHRTNRTLSANLNRLNLGTRSFAATANANMVALTLRARHDHPQQRVDSPGIWIPRGIGDPKLKGYPMPRAPKMPPASSWPVDGPVGRVGVVVVAGATRAASPLAERERACRAEVAAGSPRSFRTSPRRSSPGSRRFDRGTAIVTPTAATVAATGG